jgi:hypothetical protein
VGGVITGSSASVTGAVSGASASVSGGVTAASVAGGVITGSSASVTGTVTAASTVGGVITGSSASVTGGVTAASVAGGVITGSSASVTGAVTGSSLVGTITSSQVTTALGFTPYNSTNPSGYQTTSGTVATVSTAAQPNITSVGSSLTTSGTLTVNSNNNATAITNGGTNGGGNIGASGATFNTVYAKATTAQYADLAEKYTADAAYAPGTVVVFGGTHEVTVNAVDADRRVAGVVSTNPGFLMNEGLHSEFTVALALTGRVPCMVIGPVRKGDLMVSAGLGRARAEADPQVGTVIGKALEDFDGAEGTIEVVVGRF